ncbi:hypothetical protein ACN42_g9146 [Penicillium freii]|uniref:Uncharacterized protein n=1 Tax=Penicillium freii TaxID=48697 RepID=A0A101MCG9_PENFR|nr:hypothetical protein ACN42_g9146 [Penicillium freii]
MDALPIAVSIRPGQLTGNSRIRKPWKVPREYEGRSGDSDERVEGSDKERAMRTSVRSDLERWGKNESYLNFKRVWRGGSRVLGSTMHTPYLIAIYLSFVFLIMTFCRYNGF